MSLVYQFFGTRCKYTPGLPPAKSGPDCTTGYRVAQQKVSTWGLVELQRKR